MRARSILEFYDTLRAFEKQPVPEGNRVSILTHMGGPGTICIDEISATNELQLAKLSPETVRALKNICAPMANIGHPDGYVDLTAAHYENLHNQVLQILFQDENVDMVMQILAPSAFLDQKLLVEEIVEIFDNYQFETQVLVASCRNPLHIREAALLGADVATMPYKVLEQLLRHPLTDIGLERFLKDWEKVKKQ